MCEASAAVRLQWQEQLLQKAKAAVEAEEEAKRREEEKEQAAEAAKRAEEAAEAMKIQEEERRKEQERLGQQRMVETLRTATEVLAGLASRMGTGEAAARVASAEAAEEKARVAEEKAEAAEGEAERAEFGNNALRLGQVQGWAQDHHHCASAARSRVY